MKKPSNLHDLSLMPLLTFVSVIGSQIHTLSTSASPVIETTFTIDAFNTTKKILSPSSDAGSTASLSAAAATTPTFTVSSLHGSKTSMAMSGSTTTNGSGGSATSDAATVGSHTSGSSSGSLTSSSSSTSAMPDGSATSSLANKSLTSTSNIPLEFALSKKWMGSDAVSFRGFSPSASVSASASASSSASVSTAGGVVDRPRTFRNKHHHEHHWGPFFEEPLNSTSPGDNLVSTAHLFTEAALNCRVGMLKDKTVMWVRRTTEKVSLLTVGNVTYSGDPRIRVKFQYPNNWRLLINPTHRDDAGVYMCQVSTHPPRVFTTNLTVLEPPLRLIDDQEREVGDRYYKAGSTIDLQCQVSRSFMVKEKLKILKSIQPYDQNQTKASTHKSVAINRLGAGHNELVINANQSAAKPGHALEKQFNNFIFWTKDDEALPASAVKRSSSTEKWLTSRVSIPDAKLVDSGNYSCSIGKLFAAIVQVQVLTGELPAAVQHNYAPPTQPGVAVLLQFCWISHLIIVAFTVISRNISPSTRIGL